MTNKKRIQYNLSMAGGAGFSFADQDGMPHHIYIAPNSMRQWYWPSAEFRQDALTPLPASATEFTMSIERPATEHRVRLNQVTKWVEETRHSSAGVLKRQNVRALLDKP